MKKEINEETLLQAAREVLPADLVNLADEMFDKWKSEDKPTRLKFVYAAVIHTIVDVFMAIDEEMDGLLAWCDIQPRHGHVGYLYEFHDDEDYLLFERYVQNHANELTGLTAELTFFRQNCINRALHERRYNNNGNGKQEGSQQG